MAAAAGPRARGAQRLLPEPERLWIAYAPRAWPCAPVAPAAPADPAAPVRWLDLSRGCFGRPGEASEAAAGSGPAEHADLAELPGFPDGPFDDVLYVPPVAPEHRAARDRALAPILEAGTPVVVQLVTREPMPDPAGSAASAATATSAASAGVLAVVDLLEPLLAGETDPLERVPPDAVAVWPLVSGLTDGEELREAGLARLARAGVSTVQGVVPDLSPAERRMLAEGRDESVFDALFHGRAPDPRELARAVVRHGMAPFAARPLPRPPLAGAPGREIGGLLLLAGELCQRLGQHGRGQAHFRAARWIDRSRYDLRVLAAEGNLQVIHWLDPASREIVEEWARAGRSATVDGLLEEYAGPVR